MMADFEIKPRYKEHIHAKEVDVSIWIDHARSRIRKLEVMSEIVPVLYIQYYTLSAY